MALTIKVISWNLHGVPYFWKSRKIRMKAALEASVEREPDFVSFEEVWSPSDARFLARIAQGLGFQSFTGPDGWGRGSGGLMTLYNAQSWKLLTTPQFERYRSHASDLKIYEADGIGHKGILSAELSSRDSDSSILILVTHLQAQYSHGRTYERVRRLQAEQLDSAIQRIHSDQLCLILGDFNTTPIDANVYRVLTRSCLDLTLEYRSKCDVLRGARCGTAFDTPTRLSWIDYVLTTHSAAKRLQSSTLELIQNVAPDSPYSDHDGLFATLAFGEEPPKGESMSVVLKFIGTISRRSALRGIISAAFQSRFSNILFPPT